MRKSLSCVAVCALTAVFVSGCAGPESKLGRGINNSMAIVHGTEVCRSIEQTTLMDGTEAGYSTGFVKGFTKTLARTGVGLYEVVTFPFPPYGPVATDYLSPHAVKPDSWIKNLPDDSTFNTDTYIGFSGGAVTPFIPSSRFTIFPN